MTDAWREVADRVFVRRYREWNGEPFDQNIGAILGAMGIVVIDTRASHRLADVLHADLARLSKAPLAAFVNTHHHWDHSWGNARFGDVPGWGHVRCAERVLADSEGIRGEILDEDPGLADELKEVVFTPPANTFAERATLDLGDRQLELRYLGRGHTDNDVAVVVPDAHVVFAGDLLENNAAPSYGDAFPAAWARTVRDGLVPLIDGPVVPGHGDVGDAAFARTQADELASMARLGEAAARGELDAAEAIRRAPYPAEVARTALERSRLELVAPAADPGARA